MCLKMAMHDGYIYVHLQESQSGSHWRQCDDFGYITNLFPSKSCMAARNLRPGSGINYAPKTIRYAPVTIRRKKNGCGAPAPSTFLSEEPSMITEDSKEKKTHNFTNNQKLLFTTTGDRLPPVAVSDYTYLFLFKSLMYYSVVQWLSRWGWSCHLHELQHYRHLHSLCRFWN